MQFLLQNQCHLLLLRWLCSFRSCSQYLPFSLLVKTFFLVVFLPPIWFSHMHAAFICNFYHNHRTTSLCKDPFRLLFTKTVLSHGVSIHCEIFIFLWELQDPIRGNKYGRLAFYWVVKTTFDAWLLSRIGFLVFSLSPSFVQLSVHPFEMPRTTAWFLCV